MKLKTINKTFNNNDGKQVNFTAVACPVTVNGLSYDVPVSFRKDDFTAKTIVKNNIDICDLQLRLVTKGGLTYQNAIVVVGTIEVPVVVSDEGKFIINLSNRK